jgi:hypothetical protein
MDNDNESNEQRAALVPDNEQPEVLEGVVVESAYDRIARTTVSYIAERVRELRASTADLESMLALPLGTGTGTALAEAIGELNADLFEIENHVEDHCVLLHEAYRKAEIIRTAVEILTRDVVMPLISKFEEQGQKLEFLESEVQRLSVSMNVSN